MVIRIASAVLGLAGLLALLTGLLFWTGIALNLMSVHMLLGLLAVAALLIIGVGQLFSPAGNAVIAAGAVVTGGLTIFVGLYQSTLMVGHLHWVIEVLHLTLGIVTIGLGHMGAARYRRGSSV
jgi:hypothetical protein